MGRVLRRREAIGRGKRGARGLPDSILVVTVALAVGAAAFQGLAHVANAVLFDYSVLLIDADHDHSAFGWAGSAATIAGVPAALMLAGMDLRRRRMFFALAAILCFLSLDDAIFIHERIAELDTSFGLGSSGGRVVWPVVYLPLLLGLLVVLLTVAGEAPSRVGAVLRAGAGLLVAAVALEASSYALVHLGYGFRDWPFAVEIVLEEGAELAGWILISGALTATAAIALIESATSSVDNRL